MSFSKCRIASFVLATCVVSAIQTTAWGQVTWDGGGTNDSWSTAANWSPNGVPASTARVTLGDDPSGGFYINLGNTTRTARSLTVTGLDNVWSLYNGRLSATEYLRIEQEGTLDLSDENYERHLAITSPLIDLRTNGYLTMYGDVSHSIGSVAMNDGSLALDSFSSFSAPITVSAGINNLNFASASSTTLNSVLSGTGVLSLDAAYLGEIDFLPLYLSGASGGFNGQLNVFAGVVRVTRADALGVGGFNSQTMTIVDDGASLEFEGTWTSSEHIAVGGDGADFAGALRSISGTQQLTSAIHASSDLQIGVEAGAALEHANVIYIEASQAPATLYKTGGGTFRFVNGGSTSLPIVVEEGYLALRTYSGALPGQITVDDGAILTKEAHYQFNANSTELIVDGLYQDNFHSDDVASLNGTGVVQVNGALGIGANGSNSTFSGVLEGTGSVFKNGAGTLTLDGTERNTFTGTLTVNGGTVNLNTIGGGTSGALVLGPTTRVNLANGGQTYGRNPVTINGQATLDLTSFYDDFGDVTFNGNSGEIIASGGAGFAVNSITVRNGVAWIHTAFSSDTILPINVEDGAMLRSTAWIPDLFPPTLSTSLVKNGNGTLWLGGTNPDTYTGSTTVNGGTLVLAKSSSRAAFSVNNNAKVTLTLGAHHVLTVTSLEVGPSARLDLLDGGLIVNYSGASPMASIASDVIAARAGGNWSGPGITASVFTSRQGVGFAEASFVLGASGGSWMGQTVDGTSILVRQTLLGDLNLSGTVDFDDLLKLAQNYAQPSGNTWARGDVTYDGVANFDDLLALAQNYGLSLATAEAMLVGANSARADFLQDFALVRSLLPEPTALAVPLVFFRRRRHH